MAVEFLAAANAQDLSKSPPSLVAYFLFGHALELALKAMLIVHGTTHKALRTLGHDLARIRDAVVEVVRPDILPLTDHDNATIDLLSADYHAKALEYVEPGFMRLPTLDGLQTTVERVVREITAYVENRVRNDLRADRVTLRAVDGV